MRLVPLLVDTGHAVAAMTRANHKAAELEALGAQAVIRNVYDANALTEAVTSYRPDAVINQLTDLPDDVDDLPRYSASNDRIRTEGTRNLIAAAQAAGAPRFVAQSIAWRPPGRGEIVDLHERQVLEINGVVVRYGRLYGPGTYYEHQLPPHPRIHVDAAARATPPLLYAAPGVATIVEPR
jgi:nucleoside-diphosphate-sugar epimerase